MGIHHSDCLPDTAGYDDPNKFADADDKLCQSYGLKFGTSEYADCRVRLSAQHQGAEPPFRRGCSRHTQVNSDLPSYSAALTLPLWMYREG